MITIKHKWMVFLFIFISTILFISCTQPEQEPLKSEATTLPSPVISVSAEVTSEPDDIEAMLSQMTLEEKVGQMFFIAYRKDSAGKNAIHLNSELKNILAQYHVGGFVLFSENLETIDQTTAFIQGIQDSSHIPLFVSIDEEGGIVTRLNKAPQLHSTKMPNNYIIGLTNQSEYAYQAAAVIAKEIKSLGFNMDFAPVADIFTNPSNKVIGKRAYGTDPAKVAMMVSEAVKGFQSQNIIPVLKHFPGHGDTLEDSHTGAAVVEHDLKRLTTTELIPFKEGIESGAEVIMTAHILLPNLTKEAVPASISKEIITGILREQLGFQGIVITDALEMSAISAFYDEEEAVVKAIDSGVDMLLMPASLNKAYTAVLNAISDGRLTEERIDASVRRILTLKKKYNLFSIVNDLPDAEATLGSQEHLELAEQIRKDAE